MGAAGPPGESSSVTFSLRTGGFLPEGRVCRLCPASPPVPLQEGCFAGNSKQEPAWFAFGFTKLFVNPLHLSSPDPPITVPPRKVCKEPGMWYGACSKSPRCKAAPAEPAEPQPLPKVEPAAAAGLCVPSCPPAPAAAGLPSPPPRVAAPGGRAQPRQAEPSQAERAAPG